MKIGFVAGFLLGLTTAGYCAGNTYQKASIAISPSTANQICELRIEDRAYQFNKCEDFHDGEAVEFRIQENTLFIRTNDAKELKRRVLATVLKHDPAYKPIVWLKGTIQGYGVRRDTVRTASSSSSMNLAFGGKKVKVYELHGPDANYQIDFCGSFQAGKFSPGQEVEYRVDGERLHIRHDGDKEYDCQIEGKGLPDTQKPAEATKPETTPGTAQQNL